MSSFLKEIAEAGGVKAKEKEGEGANQQLQSQQQDKQDPTEDEIFLASVNKRLGKEFKTIDEFTAATIAPANTKLPELSEDEKKAAALKKKDDAVAFALTKGKVKSNELSEYAKVEGMNARDFKFNQFKAKRLAENKELSDEEIENDFKDYYHEHSEEDDWKRKAINNRWEKEKQAYLQNKFGHISSIESEYDAHLADTAGQEQHSKRVDAVIAKMGKEKTFEWKEEDADKKEVAVSYPFKYSENTIKEVADEFKTSLYGIYKASGATDEDIQSAIENKLFLKERPRILKEMANAHADRVLRDKKLGRLGVIPNRHEASGHMNAGKQGGILQTIYDQRSQN